MHAATGEQFELALGAARAVITEVAASIRSLSIDGVDITESFALDRTPPWGCGIVLVPWPNRVRDGKWTLDGAEQQLDITEPFFNNAIHGLLRNQPYRVESRDGSSITLAAHVFPQHGYPFQLRTSVTYELRADGLRVTHEIVNLSESAAPVAVGAHPYLRIGDVPADELTLTIAASTRLLVDDQKIPVGELDVAGTEFDLRSGRRVAELELDTAFGGVTTVDGASAWLDAPDGRRVSLLQDDDWGYLQAFVNRQFPRLDGEKITAVALEPMTAPPDAFNSGSGLTWLEPEAAWSSGWGIRFQ